MPVRQPLCARILENLERVVYGKAAELSQVLVGLLAEGHLLFEDVPGVGKTTLARALARSLEVDFKRIQFAPDLMPADILGSSVLRPADGSFTFVPGPVFTHILLADEINRASPRTQSALLEAMSERQVTLDGLTRPLARPFFVLATQNPVDAHGTYPLPEAQLDRFFMRLRLGYPAEAQELEMLYGQQTRHPLETLEAVATADDLRAMQAAVRAVRVSRSVGEYVVTLVSETRRHPDLAVGASPRGSLALFHGAQAQAFLDGRDFVRPDDVQRLVEPVLAHRLELRQRSRYAGRTAGQILGEIAARVPVPT